MINLVCFGDSITEGAEFPVKARWTSLLQENLDAVKPGMYEVHNRGIGGNTSAQGIDRLSSDILPLLPGILLIQFGFNDANVYDFTVEPRVCLAEFEMNLKEFHRIAKEYNSASIFILNHSIGEVTGDQGNSKSYNDNYEPYAIAIRKVVDELDSLLIDLPLEMVKRSIKTEDFVSEDQIHLSLEANQHYADIIFDELYEINLKSVLD